MKELPQEFSYREYRFKQIAREGGVVLLQGAIGEGTPFFEVVRVKKLKGVKFPNGRVTPAHEAMPSPEQWGTDGFTYRDKDRAITRFRSMVTQDAEKPEKVGGCGASGGAK